MLPPIFATAAAAMALAQAPAPAIHFEGPHHDFGTMVSDGGKASHRYRVANRGSATLRLKGAWTSCGCSVATVGRRELMPGEETFIEVEFDPKGLQGNIHKSLEVTSNDPTEPRARLTFEATVVRAIMPSADACRLGPIARGAEASSSIRLRSMDGRPVGVRRAEVPKSPHISCAHSMDGPDAILEVTMDGSLAPRLAYSGTAQLRVTTDSRSCPRFEFPVRWEVEAPVTAEPGRVALAGEAGRDLRAAVKVGSIGGEAFRVLRAAPSSPLVGVEGLGGDSAASHTFEVVFSGRARAGGHFEKLVLRLDHPEQRTLEIGVAAVVR
jgi:hypothetical protein